MKQSIKTITLKKLVSSAIIVILVLIILVAYNFRQLTIAAMIDKGSTVAKFVETGLTTHMRVSTHEAKELYKQNIQQISNVENMTIIHSDIVAQQMNLPFDQERFKDPVIAEVFTTKKPMYLVPSIFSGNDTKLRVVFPYIAKKTSSINCMQCHNVAQDTVLGAVDFYIDIDQYKHISANYLLVILGILFLMLIGILLSMFNIIDKHIKHPLNVLMDDTKHSYETHTPIPVENFESAELVDVAQKVNLFNEEVLHKSDELNEKNRQLIELNKEIMATQSEIINRLGNVSETRSRETAFHVQRVAEYSYLFAKYYGLPEKECLLLKAASPMHDIGKVGIPDGILNKPAKLSEEEFEEMKKHAFLGHEIFKNSKREMLKAASIIAHQHHERWDGNGYPQKLSGKDIHIYGRITTLADVFDALGSERVYKKAWCMEDILDLLKKERGKQFDPDLVDIFLEHLDEFLMVRNSLKDIK